MPLDSNISLTHIETEDTITVTVSYSDAKRFIIWPMSYGGFTKGNQK